MQLSGKNFQILQIIINNTYEVNLKTLIQVVAKSKELQLHS